VPIVQKQIILKANMASKPVITATQMLESMVGNTRPTRAEVTDVANAIFDGTDAVMLSEETAVGSYPAEACRMLARIAASAESRRSTVVHGTVVPDAVSRNVGLFSGTVDDAVSLQVIRSSGSLGIETIAVPTRTGLTARRLSRFKGNAWIIALCGSGAQLKTLCLSYGVHPVACDVMPPDEAIIGYLAGLGLAVAGERVTVVRREVSSGVEASAMKILTPVGDAR
jgi:pyruvate kinase